MDLDPMQPFTRADGLRAGLSDRVLHGPSYRQVFHGIHIRSAAALTTEIVARAALVAIPEGILSGRTAAQLWGAVVPPSADIEVAIPRITRPDITGIRTHRPPRLPPFVVRGDLRLTTPEATFVRLATELELVDLVVAGDSLVKAGRTTPERLVAAATAARTRRVRLARRAARLVREGVDSPQETRLRLLLVLAGVPEPKVNHVIVTPTGEWKYRFDLSWPDLRLIVEYDGRQHAESHEQWVRDVSRREELENLGWRLIVVLADDLFVSPDRTLERVAEALAARGVTTRLTGAWQPHFPVRRSAA